MKRITALALVSIASFVTSMGAVAQEPAIKANIPFAFTVGNTKLPAGQYSITSRVEGVVRLQSSNNASVATVVSLHSNDESRSESKLVFVKYGDRYFLHRVLSASYSDMNLDIAPGKAEKEARIAEANSHTGQETLVATR